MKSASRRMILILATALGMAQAETWMRTNLYTEQWGEASAIGDFNRDGKKDVAVGKRWYAGPDFKTWTDFWPTGYSHGYSPTGLYAYDANNDGWDDVVVFVGQGERVMLCLNPKGVGGWKESVILDSLGGEQTLFLDQSGDGKPDICGLYKNQAGWAEADWTNPGKPWVWRAVTPKLPRLHRFAHGYGYGDVNADGTADLIESDGWWARPINWNGTTPWTFHPHEFGTANGCKGNFRTPNQAEKDNGFIYGAANFFAYDVDKDGDNDLITAIDAHGWGLAWYERLALPKANGDPDFERHVIINTRADFTAGKYPAALSQMHYLEFKDMNHDGVPDIITGKRIWPHGTGDVAGNDPEPNAAPVIYWFELKRHSADSVQFIPHLVDSQSGIGTQFEVGDLNGDGHMDVVAAGKKGANVLIQQAPFPTVSLQSTLAPARSGLSILSVSGRRLLLLSDPGTGRGGAGTLEILDLRGSSVAVLQGGPGPSGMSPKAILWDGRDAAGQEVPSGVYRVREGRKTSP